MALQIRKMLTKLFGSPEYRLLILGFDAAGKTAILYRLKSNEFIQTIPTIGFNVETINRNNVDLTIWDVGGCDKIRPLIRHYLENTKGIIFVIDSQDSGRQLEVKEELWRIFGYDALINVPVLIYLNKVDVHNGLQPDYIVSEMKLNEVKNRKWFVQSCSARTGDGLFEGLNWLISAIRSSSSSPAPPTTAKEITHDKHFEEKSLEWITQVDDDTTEQFVEMLEKHQIECFDHRVLLRAIWSHLKVNGRRKTIDSVFNAAKAYVTDVNQTLIYFWIQIVHYALESTTNAANDFATFLLMNPQLLNESELPLTYYKRDTLFGEEAKGTVILPDVKHLPSILPSSNPSNHNKVENKLSQDEASSVVELSDDAFLSDFESCSLTNWSHKTHLRMAWLYLQRNDRRVAVNKIFDGIKKFIQTSQLARKTTFHFTMTYFWIQMIDLAIAETGTRDLSFDTFLGLNSHLMNGGLFLEYYRKETLLNNPTAREEMVLPDIKPLPTIVGKHGEFAKKK